MYTVIFCGTPAFACPSLQALHDDAAFTVTTVITQPDRPAGRTHTVTSPPVKILADELNIPVIQPEDINTLSAPEVRPDFLVVVAYGQIFSRELLSMPLIAPVNVHASLLPHLRGASPIQHSILLGDTKTGITIQRMAEKLDSGPILAQEIVSIDLREDAVSLTESLAQIGARLLVATLKDPLQETPQDESSVTHCSKLTRAMGEVDPKKMTADEIDRKVRALVPWPGVKTALNGKEVKLVETSLEEDDQAVVMLCAQGSKLYILKLQSPGKNVLTGEEWGRGK
jgi:methionyl-tRNA formyltransferase